MKPPAKFNPIFDRFLLGGLGCGLVALCFLMAGFFYVWKNPPRPGPTLMPTQLVLDGLPTETPVSAVTSTPLFQFATPGAFPTALSTGVPNIVTATQSGAVIPSPAPEFDTSSPTGKIVFTCYINQVDQICLMNADGSGRVQLTSEKATSYYASISPEGSTIYFSSRRTGNFDIYSMNLKGKSLRRLTGGIGSLYAPERSPTDERIIFTNETGGTQQIWAMRVDGNNPHALTAGPEDIDPTWSQDGLRIAFASARTGQRQLYVMDRDGSEVKQVTNLPNMGGRSSWSQDGSRLTFYAGPVGDHNIYVINVDGTGLVQLTNGGDNLGPSWSPDGHWIAFTSFRDGNNEIYIIRPDGTGLTRLTNNSTSDWQPRWGP
jgi:TolB protein